MNYTPNLLIQSSYILLEPTKYIIIKYINNILD